MARPDRAHLDEHSVDELDTRALVEDSGGDHSEDILEREAMHGSCAGWHGEPSLPAKLRRVVSVSSDIPV